MFFPFVNPAVRVREGNMHVYERKGTSWKNEKEFTKISKLKLSCNSSRFKKSNDKIRFLGWKRREMHTNVLFVVKSKENKKKANAYKIL